MLNESLKFPTNKSARECRVSQSFKLVFAISGLLGAGEFAVAVQPPDVVQSDISQNTAMGSYALANMAGGYNNTAAGAAAGYGISTGGNNVAIGFAAMDGGNGLMTGSDNVGIGIESLAGNTSGSFNTAVGGETMLLNLHGIPATTTSRWAATHFTTTRRAITSASASRPFSRIPAATATPPPGSTLCFRIPPAD
jgi:hypothetical protein